MTDEVHTAESDHLHRCLFGTPVPDELSALWLAADAHLAGEPGGAVAVDMGRIVTRKLDAEAIELWLRLTRGRNRLTQKMQAMCYLAELRPDHQSWWVGRRPSWLGASLVLSFHAVRTAWKLLKGLFLVRYHRLLP